MTEKLYLDDYGLDTLQQALLEALSHVSKQERAILAYNSIVCYLVGGIFKSETDEYRSAAVQQFGRSGQGSPD